MIKFLSSLFINAGKYVFLPLIVGGTIFYLSHEWVDNHLLFRFPRLTSLPITNYVENLGNGLVFNSDMMTENKTIYLYFIMFSLSLLCMVGWNYPTAGVILLTVILCIIEYMAVMYYNLNEGQTTIFNGGGLSIERIPSLDSLRLLYECGIDQTNLIGPGYNPCKMARDALHAHADGHGLLQDKIEEVWIKEQTYNSPAYAASRYYHMPLPHPATEAQSTTYDSLRGGGYYDFFTFPEKAVPLDPNVAPHNNYPDQPRILDRDDKIGTTVWVIVGVLAGNLLYESYIAGTAAEIAPPAIGALFNLIYMGIGMF